MAVVRALVGTRKGLFILSGSEDRRSWQVAGVTLEGWAVHHAVVDPRDGTMYAAANHLVYGPTVQRSADQGRTWTRSTAMSSPSESGVVLEAVWHLTPGLVDQPGTLYLAAAPALVFRSDDFGATWLVNDGILDHPTRDRWLPAAGGMICNGVELDPTDPKRLYISISAAGTLRSDDAGETWALLNNGVEAGMLPDPFPEVGQCVHKLLVHPLQPARLWQQNHCGTYRSDDHGETWERVDLNGVPSEFGFPLMIDPTDPDVAYVIPEVSYEYHYTTHARLGVYRTKDAGKSWDLLDDGLPSPSWVAVLREASAFDADSVYFGTQSGSLFSLTAGDRWVEAARHLPPILSVEVD
jgi:photosystem II stability/assembly factor-like uncharacterized protein